MYEDNRNAAEEWKKDAGQSRCMVAIGTINIVCCSGVCFLSQIIVSYSHTIAKLSACYILFSKAMATRFESSNKYETHSCI